MMTYGHGQLVLGRAHSKSFQVLTRITMRHRSPATITPVITVTSSSVILICALDSVSSFSVFKFLDGLR